MAAPQTGKPSPALPPGLSAADWGSIRSEYERNRNTAIPTENGYVMRSSGQASKTQFDAQGFLVQPDEGGWTWGLSLKSYGFSGREFTPVLPPRLNAEGSIVTWERDDCLREWMVNDARGLEHGFTVSERPRVEEDFFPECQQTFLTSLSEAKADNTGRLSLSLSVRGTLHAEVQSDGLGVFFTNAEGASVLTYSGLKVWDADGKVLPARFEPAPSGEATLRLSVDETGARYPLTIDPIIQQAYLKASNSGAGDQFGYAVAASGNTVAVCALNDDVGGASSGAVYIFVRGTTGWTQQGPALKASNPGVGDLFGWSLGLSGDTLVVGAPYEDSDAMNVGGSQSNNGRTDSGAAYIFTRTGINWSQKAYLKASNASQSQYFGQSAAVSGNTVVIGAHYESSDAKGVNNTQNQSNQNAVFSGAAYVFVLGTNGVWAPDAYLKASNTSVGALFGYSAAISGDTIVIGGFGEFSNATDVGGDELDHSMENAGSAYVFFRSNGTWTQQAYLKASNTEKDDKFGCSVGISGDTIVVGAMHEDGGSPGVNGTDNNNSHQSGAAYIFTRANNTWSPKAYLKASNPGEQDAFGYSVAISGDTIAVGSLQEGSSTTGINSTSDNNAPNSGAVYVFVRNSTNNTWSPQAYLKASNTGGNDFFGRSVAVSGNYVVTGAVGEASNAMGVNGNQSDNTNPYSGAAYVFARNTTWTQDAYLKASNTTANSDQFGYSVAVSGDIVVVGAPQESSNATSVDGNQGDTSAMNAGAAYVFARTNGVWTQEAYLKASNAEAQDYFGWSVAAASDYVFVGAKGEDGGTPGINNSNGLTDNTKTDAGAAYIFTRSGNTWLQTAHLKAANPNPANLDHFGIAVAASGDTVVVGADDQDLAGTAGAGGAYVFVRTGNVWAQQDFLKVAHPFGETRFGGSVAISGDTIVVGADREDSAAMGVNGDPLNTSPGILNSGAAFVFTRDGTGDWTEQAYLKASNTGQNDGFGWSVGVAGNTVVVELTTKEATPPASIIPPVKATTTLPTPGRLISSNAPTTYGPRRRISKRPTPVPATRSDNRWLPLPSPPLATPSLWVPLWRAAMPPGSTASRATTVPAAPAQSICSAAAPPETGASRLTSKPPTPASETVSAKPFRCPAARWPWVPFRRTATPEA